MEWKFNKKWNPFNSAKLLAHVERWSKIVRGQEIPPPVTVTIDPTNKCNLNCQWCNAKQVRQGGGEISLEVLTQIVKFLSEWGVKAVCIAGGGEPTLHSGFGELISMLMAENIRIGVVTNGTHLDDWQQYLLYCDWVGVSIDAGNSGTYEKYKGRDEFFNVLNQSKRLIDMARGLNRPLAMPGLGNGAGHGYRAGAARHDSRRIIRGQIVFSHKHKLFHGLIDMHQGRGGFVIQYKDGLSAEFCTAACHCSRDINDIVKT